MSAERIALALELNILMAVALVAIAICGTVVARKAFDKTEKGAARSLSLMVQRAGVLQLMTVQTIVMTIITLRILDLLGAEATVTVLSGIAGYVLGGLNQRAATGGDPGEI